MHRPSSRIDPGADASAAAMSITSAPLTTPSRGEPPPTENIISFIVSSWSLRRYLIRFGRERPDPRYARGAGQLFHCFRGRDVAKLCPIH